MKDKLGRIGQKGGPRLSFDEGWIKTTPVPHPRQDEYGRRTVVDMPRMLMGGCLFYSGLIVLCQRLICIILQWQIRHLFLETSRKMCGAMQGRCSTFLFLYFRSVWL